MGVLDSASAATHKQTHSRAPSGMLWLGTVLIIFSAFTLGGCNPFAFDDLRDEASTRVVEPPTGYPISGFGRVLATYSGTLSGQQVSRLGMTAGPDSPLRVYAGWNGSEIDLNEPLSDGCNNTGDCGSGSGAALAGFATWQTGTANEEQVCLLVTSPNVGELRVRCESSGNVNQTLTGPTGGLFGATALGIDDASSVGVAILGAPEEQGKGALYRLPDGSGPVTLDVTDSAIPTGGKLGSSLAVWTEDPDHVWVASGAPEASRVVVLRLEHDGMGNVTSQVRSCIDSSSTAYGTTLAWGDLDGDDKPELLVGSKSTAENRLQGVHVFTGSDVPQTEGCQDWGSEPLLIECIDDLEQVGCTNNGFGGAVASGDVNADGLDDVLIGAPFATVEGRENAGATYIVAGNTGALDTSSMGLLAHSSPEKGDMVGSHIAMLKTNLGDGNTPRSEPVVSAPGRSSALVFLCTNVAGDDPSVGTRCQPQ